ncbi:MULTISPECIES: S8 family serine peptidase [Bradyrhizobium]|uniref:S8 family serine peptidase n=1 Tax=Bradyrhizobium TaxID=374 RepID=UPI00155E26F0|nr:MULTISPECIES: S8 family serine peptidase [Bradyrhizobium]
MTIPYDPDRYLVLRIDGPMPTGLSKLQSMDSLRPEVVEAIRASPPRLTLEATTLSDKQRAEVLRDPRQEAAPPIPMALIAPVDCTAARIERALRAAKEAGASWGIGAVRAANYTISAARPKERDVPVAILDTGINKNHSAFVGIKTWHTQNFIAPGQGDTVNTNVTDVKGHGTHCASTIFGRDVDGVRIGVAPGVTTAIVAKVLDDNGRGSNEAISNALQWARLKDARIISMSIGFDFPAIVERLKEASWSERGAVSKALQSYRDNVRYFDKLVDFLSFEGRLLIAAAGNDSQRGVVGVPDQLIDVSMPAATENVISVGALSRIDTEFSVAPFSNINPMLSAPGVDIVGANVSGGLIAMSGTSMACPHVAGLAALWWDKQLVQNGQTSADDVKASLRALAENVGLRVTDQGRGLPVAPAP